MVKKLSVQFFLLNVLLMLPIKPAAVTYGPCEGRFGDAVIEYLHAKWISFLYDIPLLYKPFIYSDQLVLHTQEQLFSSEMPKTFSQVIVVERDKKITFDRTKNILYVIPYFPESDYEHHLYSSQKLLFKVDWTNPFFKKTIKTLLTPIHEVRLPLIPKDEPSIAVHVRTKSGADILMREGVTPGLDKTAYSDYNFPLKHITDDYYVAQIKHLHDLLGKQKVYVYIFTDDANPPAVKNRIEKAVDRPNITFDCRLPGDHHQSGVVDDFFALTQFQYFVGNDSNFSMVASFVSDYLIAIRPIYDWRSGKVLIDEAKITVSPAVLSLTQFK